MTDKTYAVWWLSQEDCETLGDIECPDEEIYQDDGLDLPDYIRFEYRSRNGRPGRGRLWISRLLSIEKGWEIPEARFDPPIGQALARDYGGIVIHADDAHLVACLPGCVTDVDLNYWRL